jgi:hypothetical protein
MSDEELKACCVKARECVDDGDEAGAKECLDKLEKHCKDEPKGLSIDQTWIKVAIQLAIQILQQFLSSPATFGKGRKHC